MHSFLEVLAPKGGYWACDLKSIPESFISLFQK